MRRINTLTILKCVYPSFYIELLSISLTNVCLFFFYFSEYKLGISFIYHFILLKCYWMLLLWFYFPQMIQNNSITPTKFPHTPLQSFPTSVSSTDHISVTTHQFYRSWFNGIIETLLCLTTFDQHVWILCASTVCSFILLGSSLLYEYATTSLTILLMTTWII